MLARIPQALSILELKLNLNPHEPSPPEPRPLPRPFYLKSYQPLLGPKPKPSTSTSQNLTLHIPEIAILMPQTPKRDRPPGP